MKQQRLEELLKKKGIGPEGSKSLKKEELEEIKELLLDRDVSLTTKATLMTALLTLDPNEDEKTFLKFIYKNVSSSLPQELHFFINDEDKQNNSFRNLINKIIKKYELTENECMECMNFLFDEKTEDYLKGAFLEAERLKRESFFENKAFFTAMWDKAIRIEIDIPILIDICDSYDGSNRSKNFSVFTAALLASAGFPTIVNGVDQVSPKNGYTSHQILRLAGKNPLKPISEVANDIQNKEVSWGYIDQQIFLPELYNLKNMRKEMVKRPFLATFEKLLQPIRSLSGNYIITGFTHQHYRQELVKQLQVQKKCKQALVVKGVEGSTHMSLMKDTIAVHFDGEYISDNNVNPLEFGLEAIESKQDKSLTAQDSLSEGLAALNGEHNFARENILYLAVLIVTKFNLMQADEALKIFKDNLDTGIALEFWKKGCY